MTTSRGIGHDDLWVIPRPSDPQLSPDGSRLAFVVTVPDQDRDGYDSAIWDTPTEGEPRRRQLTAGPRDRAPRWSPDGTQLAFLRSPSDDEPPQLHLLPITGGEARRLTDLAGGAGEPAWSPDGSRLAFSATVRADQGEHEPAVVDRLDYKADGVGLVGGHRSHLFVVDVASGETRQLTFGDFSVSSPVWSPDGSRLAYSASAGPDGDLDVAQVVYSLPAGGGRPAALTPLDGLYQVAAWSPEGDTLLVFGQTHIRDGHDLLYVVPAQPGGDPVPLAPGFDRNIMPGATGYPGARPRYSDSGARILFCARDRGCVHVFAVPAGGGQPEVVIGGDRVVGGLSAAGGQIAFVAASSSSPGEVWVGDRQVTALFDEALPEVELVAPQPMTFRAPDGAEVHGWIIRAESTYGPSPLLVDVHGGPHNAWGPVFDGAHLYHQTLAQAGWTILTINPRGSDGYGENFWTAVVGSWGKADEDDFLAAVDDLVARGLVDPGRLAISGYSYGGYMTCWLTSRTDRFAAAVMGGGVCDLVSLAGTSDLGRHLARVELKAPVTDALDALLELSPITRVSAVRTPTLILHAERDDRCPVGQAEEWLAALRDQRVPVEMVLYPGANHPFILTGKPSYRIDYGRRLAAWVTDRLEGQVPRRRRVGDLEHRLGELIRRHKVPGASVAVLAEGDVLTAAAGVLNTSTGQRATPDSLWQIGSITKVYTATLLLQLVEQGQLDLDAPVSEVLSELRLADPDVAKTVTLRHLLAHTSGIQGDSFLDTGRGDDCIAAYVAACEDLGQCHPLGATMSYCNTGYVIAGRIVEQLTGQVWDAALKTRLLDPVGLSDSVTLPEEAIRRAVAVGHAGEPPQPVSTWSLPRSCGPAGQICATAADVIGFTRMHLEGGAGVLTPATVAAMQEPQVAVPDPYTLGTHWGLGWILFDWNRKVYGHDGGTIGQAAFLRVVPDAGFAVALLTNGGHAQDLYRDLVGGLLEELAGVVMPERPSPPAQPPPVDLDAHVGVYERVGHRFEISRDGTRLKATATVTGLLASMVPEPTTEYELTPVEDDLYVTRLPGVRTWAPLVFYRLADGSPYLHFGMRATPRIG